AEHIDQPRAVRAVAGACAANSLAVIVPCHRVVRGRWRPGPVIAGERRRKATAAGARGPT
ncbi:hypothetical protein CQA65_30315, partial [Klebsiella pneumoniae]